MGLFDKIKKQAIENESINNGDDLDTKLITEKEQEKEQQINEDTIENNSENDFTTPEAAKRREYNSLFDDSYSIQSQGDYIKAKGVDEYTDDIIEYFTRIRSELITQLDRGRITKDVFIREVKDYIRQLGIPDDIATKVYKNFSQFLWSYDILDELIDDPDIQDIKCLSWDTIRIKKFGKRYTQNLKFRSKEHYIRFVEHAAIKNKISISDQNALQNFVDKDSNQNAILRFNITTKFVNSTEMPYLHIRKISKNKYTLQQLIDAGMASKETFDYLIKAAATRDGILFTGKGASGKTTLMNFLIDKIPDTCSGLVIQENEELFSKHPDLMFQHTVLNRGEGKIQYDLKDLARNGLLTDLDYFIIGEIKGGEALYMLNAAYTGHKCWASVHGASSTEAINKLVDYIKYQQDYTREEAMQMLTHIDTIVFMKDFKVAEIAEVTGWNEETKQLKYKNIPIN